MVIKRAYLYYWSGSEEIITDAIAFAMRSNIDMFDAINLSENKKIIRSLGFKEGTGTLKYHLYNYKKSPVPSYEIDFILF